MVLGAEGFGYDAVYAWIATLPKGRRKRVRVFRFSSWFRRRLRFLGGFLLEYIGGMVNKAFGTALGWFGYIMCEL